MAVGRWRKTVRLGVGLVALLQNEEVRRGLRGASAGLREWADRRREQLARIDTQRLGPMARFSDKFGHGSLVRRIDSLTTVIPEVTSVHPGLADDLRVAEADLRRAVNISAQMPMTKRWRVERTIGRRLDEIETALIDAVLSSR
jgi:hypothetical protein